MSPQRFATDVHVHSVSHQFSGARPVLQDISIEISAGEFVAILGPSGCGKSTLLRFLAALDLPTQGKIEFGSSDPIRGFVFQEPRLLPWRSVFGNVKLPLELRGESSAQVQEKVNRAIERVGLKQAMSLYPAQLSGGMKMRASVARALVVEPTLLLLDEPFSALDEKIRLSLQEELRSLWRTLKMTVIFVTHSLAEAVFLADRVILLSGSPAQVIQDRKIHLPSERLPSLRTDPLFHSEVQAIRESMNENSEGRRIS